MQANAVVLAVRNRSAVILESGGIYEEIPNQGYSVGQRIEWTRKKNALPMSKLRRGLMVAACLVLLLASSVIAGTKYLPWTYVSVALGETAVQYCLNARNEVLSAEADTEEGRTVLEQVAVSPYEPIEETMARTLKAMRQDQAEEAPVHVEIASRFGDGQRAEDAVAEAGKAAEMELSLEQVPWQDKGMPMDHLPEAEQEKRPQPTEQQEQPTQEKHEALPPAGETGMREADRMEQMPSAQSNEPLESDHLPESSVPEAAPKRDSMPPQGFAADSPLPQDQTPPGDPPDPSLNGDSMESVRQNNLTMPRNEKPRPNI